MKPIESQRGAARRERLTVAVTAFLLLLSVPQSRAGILPAPSVITGLCAQAAVIAEGDHVGNDRVKVLKLYKGSEQAGTNREIVVAGLEKWSQRASNDGENLQTGRVVLFMDSQLRPLYLVGDGSGGVFLWSNAHAGYNYLQLKDPRSYVRMKLPMTAGDLRSNIAAGVAVATEWEAVKSLKEPKAMARRMAAYLRPATWPRGYAGEFFLELPQRMAKLGADAVAAVVEALRAGMKAGEDLNLPVSILYRIGRPAQPAVPVLLELLEKPGKTSRYYICAALRTAGDPQVIPAIRPLLSSGDIQTAVEAARTLAAMGDQQSFDEIAALLPKVDVGRGDQLRDLLSALDGMDAHKAASIVERYLHDPTWAKWGDFIKPPVPRQPGAE